VLDAAAVGDLRVRSDERRRLDRQPPGDFRRVHADPGAVADQRPAVNDDVQRSR
jgi:hypothetical protein